MSTRANNRPVLLSPQQQSAASSFSRQTPSTAFDHEAVKRRIRRAGMDVLQGTELPNSAGMKYTLIGGAVVTVYNNGNHLVQGKVSDADRRRLQRALSSQ